MKTLMILAVSASLSALAATAGAQEATTATAFPTACKSDMASTMAMDGGEMAKQDHQKAAMDGMKQMHGEMMQGMMKDDADVAFILAGPHQVVRLQC